MRYDLHNHTTRCNHAVGTMDEYIEQAIKRGIDGFGFACHAPMEFDKAYRMSLSELSEYQDDVLKLKAQYAGVCDIVLGLEVDYLPGYMEESVLNFECDYLIGSVHFIEGWGFDNPAFIAEYDRRDLDECWRIYLHETIAMAGCGYFDIVGHFDLFKVFGHQPSGHVQSDILRTLEAIKESGMTMEINAAGLRKKVAEAYPSAEILRLAHTLEIPITFSSDAHAPEQVGYAREEIERMAKEAGYTHYAIFHKRQREMIPLR